MDTELDSESLRARQDRWDTHNAMLQEHKDIKVRRREKHRNPNRRRSTPPNVWV